jgi:hypothetical protein
VFDSTVEITWDAEGSDDDIRDPDTGTLTPPPGDTTMVWTGDVMLRPDRQTRASRRNGGQSLTDDDHHARLPDDAPEIPLAAVLTVVASKWRPRLAGRTMVVTKIDDGSMAVTQIIHLLAQPRGPDT